MFGSICGDVIGSTYEFYPVKFKEFTLLHEDARITDDTICTLAVASSMLRNRAFDDELRSWGASAVGISFGSSFTDWLRGGGDGLSAGNGAAMRVGAIAWLTQDLTSALRAATRSCITSHDHPDSIRAAQATVAATRLGIEGWSLKEMGAVIAEAYDYDLVTPLDEIRPDFTFEILAAKTMPPSLRAVIEARDFEDAMRNAISLGGDADTMAAIAGGVAEAFFPISDEITQHVMARLPLAAKEVLTAFKTAKQSVQTNVSPRQAVPAILKTELDAALQAHVLRHTPTSLIGRIFGVWS